MGTSRVLLATLVATSALYFSCRSGPTAPEPAPTPTARPVDATATTPAPQPALPALPAHVEKALDWLAGAQQPNGGWGAGSHARQDIRDAHAVPTDPATTAVAAMALVRAGNALDHGDYAAVLQKATDHLLGVVESAKDEGPQITDLTGTQPQAKMGQNVDTALTAQFFARLLHETKLAADVRTRVQRALDKCLRKIEGSQTDNGSWAAGGWAPVLQSAQMCSALELGELAGRTIDSRKLELARAYQRGQVTSTPPASDAAPGASGGFTVRSDTAAGVALYASASNMRNVAAQAKAAADLVEDAVDSGTLGKGAKVDRDTLQKLGLDSQKAAVFAESFAMNTAAKERAFDESVLDGFGNNGGEEFLSYQMKAESLVIDAGEESAKWRARISERLAKVQNQDGSWSGHHCITSPTFCTATAIACLTADRDVEWLKKSATLAAK
ncbi:MAG: terpene cyclase/mutase family protein [Planctomycetes bacterium]|nr:terpene cyclase/mutase family protein [Planctomycetota bacterium]